MLEGDRNFIEKAQVIRHPKGACGRKRMTVVEMKVEGFGQHGEGLDYRQHQVEGRLDAVLQVVDDRRQLR